LGVAYRDKLSVSLCVLLRIYSLKKGAEYEDLAVDLYVILKVSFPLLMMNHWQNNPFVLGVMVYVMLETILYIPP
jgi:hypothetical protein